MQIEYHKHKYQEKKQINWSKLNVCAINYINKKVTKWLKRQPRE